MDLTDQVELNNQLNRLISERNVLLEQSTNMLGQQADLQQSILDTLQNSISIDPSSNVTALSTSLIAAAGGAALLTGRTNSLNASLGRTATTAVKTISKIELFKTAIKTLTSAYGALKSIISSIFHFVVTVGKSVFDIVKSVISFPLQVHKALIKTANEIIDISPIAQALEEVRKQFGDLNVSTGAIIKDTYKPMRAEFNQLAASGHSFAKTFGMGREGVAAAIKFNAELMGALKGGTYELRREIGENIAEHAIYRKSMGMTAEQQAALIHKANQQGKSSTELQQDMAKFALSMGKRFGFSAKEMGSAMAEMSADVANFGTLTNRHYAQIAVYTKKLGIETKQLQGLINKYDNFEDAAKSASMLNQTFGMQLDVLKMLREEDPAARLRQLQDSFQATGRSYDRLSRVERKRLADLAGLDEAAAQAAFSQHGLSMSYDEIVAAGENTEGSTKSLDSTMKELSKNMERILQLGKTFSSFFEAVFEGFSFGFFRLTPAYKLLGNIRKTMRMLYTDAKGLGPLFYNLFPGVQQLVKGLTEFYDPEKFRERFGKIIGIFTNFFTTIQDPKKIRSAFNTLWDEMSSIIKSMFDPNNKENSDIREGLDKFATTLGNIALVFADKIFGISAKLLRAMADIFSGKKTFKQAFKDIFGADNKIFEGLEQRFGENFRNLAKTFTENFLPALKEAFQTFLQWLGPQLKIMFEVLTPYIQEALTVLVPIIIQALTAIWEGLPTEIQAVLGASTGLNALGGLLGLGGGLAGLTGLFRGAPAGGGATPTPRGKWGKLALGGLALTGGAVAYSQYGNEEPTSIAAMQPPPQSGPPPTEGWRSWLHQGDTFDDPEWESYYKNLKTGLDLGSMVPYANIVAAPIKAGIKQHEIYYKILAGDILGRNEGVTKGDFLEYGLDILSVIPGAGTVTKSAKFAGTAGDLGLFGATMIDAATPQQGGTQMPGLPPELQQQMQGLEAQIAQNMDYNQRIDLLATQIEDLKGMEEKIKKAKESMPSTDFVDGLVEELEPIVEQMKDANDRLIAVFEDNLDPAKMTEAVQKISNLVLSFNMLATQFKAFGSLPDIDSKMIKKKLMGLNYGMYLIYVFTTQKDLSLIGEKGISLLSMAEKINESVDVGGTFLDGPIEDGLEKVEAFFELFKELPEKFATLGGPENKFLNPVAIKEKLAGLRDGLQLIYDYTALETINGGDSLKRILGKINQHVKVEDLTPGADKINSIMTAILATPRLLANMGGSEDGGLALNGANIGKKLLGLTQALHKMYLFTAADELQGGYTGWSIKGYMKNFNLLNPEDFKGGASKMAAIIFYIDHVAKKLTDFGTSTPNNLEFLTSSALTQLTSSLELFRRATRNVEGGENIDNIFTLLGRIGENQAPFQQNTIKFWSVSGSMMAIPKLLNLIIESSNELKINELEGAITNIGTALDKLDTMQASFANKFTVDGVANVQRIVDNINLINRELETVMAKDVKAIVEINEALNGNKHLRITHQNLALNLKVHVTMDAKDVATGITNVTQLSNGDQINFEPLITRHTLIEEG